jgi:hypothetical protein
MVKRIFSSGFTVISILLFLVALGLLVYGILVIFRVVH